MALTIGISEARDNFSKIAAELNKTGDILTVMKNNKPYLKLVPLQQEQTITNKDTLAALAEVEEMANNPEHQAYSDIEDFFTALNKAVANV